MKNVSLLFVAPLNVVVLPILSVYGLIWSLRGGVYFLCNIKLPQNDRQIEVHQRQFDSQAMRVLTFSSCSLLPDFLMFFCNQQCVSSQMEACCIKISYFVIMNMIQKKPLLFHPKTPMFSNIPYMYKIEVKHIQLFQHFRFRF